MGILSRLTGAGDVIKSGFALIDSMHTSEAEGIAARVKAKTDLLASYAPFKVAQRVIAWAFTFIFLFCFLVCLSVTLYSFTADGFDSKEIVSAITELMEAFKLPWAMGVILVFYFGGGAFEGYQVAKNSKEK